MLQAGKNLPLLAKSLAEQIGRQRQVDQLDGDLLLEVPIGAMRQIDGAHAAAPQQAVDLVGTDLLALGLILVRLAAAPPARLRSIALPPRRPSAATHTSAASPDHPRSEPRSNPRAFIGSVERLVEDRLNPKKVPSFGSFERQPPYLGLKL
jgi:hypothetical protein